MIDQLHTRAEASRFARTAPSPAWAFDEFEKAGREMDVVGVAHSPVAVTSRAVSNAVHQSPGIWLGTQSTVLNGGFDEKRGEGVLRGGGRAGI